MAEILLTQRRLVLQVAQATLRNGLVRGTSGNVSMRDTETGLIAITPSGISYDACVEDDIVIVDLKGRIIDGERIPSSELPMHLQVYRDHDWVNGVVHTHSIFATTLSTLARPIPAVHYLIAGIGAEIPVAPYATYGTEDLARGASAMLGESCRATLLQNHGVLAVGRTLDEAYANAETVEFLAELYLRALAVGEPVILPYDEILRVREKFKTYGQVAPQRK